MPFGKAIVSFILYGKAGNPAICKIFSFIFGTRHVLLSVQDDKMRYGFILISNASWSANVSATKLSIVSFISSSFSLFSLFQPFVLEEFFVW